MYTGLYGAATCLDCPALPDGTEYHADQETDENRAKSDAFGGGWYFVNEKHKSFEDITDLTVLSTGGYHLPKYSTGSLEWNEVLIERVSNNWCDSWGRQSDYWVEEGGASMCIQSDDEFVYCMNNNGDGHRWRRQPVSHFSALCGGEGQPDCVCWPAAKTGAEHKFGDDLNSTKAACWVYDDENPTGPAADNVPVSLSDVNIQPLKTDGSVVKITFKGKVKRDTLRIGNYNSFLNNGEGCRAIGPVQYRAYVRCTGCVTHKEEFHSKDVYALQSQMTIPKYSENDLSSFTYEAWFKSPLTGFKKREIFGGENGFLLTHKGGDCYRIHAGATVEYSSVCFDANTWYHVAITRDASHNHNHGPKVTVWVNGQPKTKKKETHNPSDTSTLSKTFGGGFGDGGQLFNVRIWNHARTRTELMDNAFVTSPTAMNDQGGLVAWWPLEKNMQDVVTTQSLQGEDTRYAMVFCSELEKSGMRGC